MKKVYITALITLIVIGLMLAVWLFVEAKNKTSQSTNNSKRLTIDDQAKVATEIIYLEDIFADFIDISTGGLRAVSLYPDAKWQIIDTNGKVIVKSNLPADVVVDEDSQLFWTPSGDYLVVFNKDKPSSVIDLKNNRKTKNLSSNIKTIAPPTDREIFYWYFDQTNKASNLSKTALSGDEWQIVGEINPNAIISSIDFSSDRSALLFTSMIAGEELSNAELNVLDIQSKKNTKVAGPKVARSVRLVNSFIVVPYLSQKFEEELAVFDQNSWQDFNKAKVIKGQQFLAIKSDKDQEIGIIIEEGDNQISLQLIPSDKTYNVKELFKNRSFAVPDSDIVADFSELTFADIKNAVIFQNNFYLQISNGIYKAKLN